MFDRLRRFIAVSNDWLFEQPILLSYREQEDWAAQPTPKGERGIRKDISRMKRVMHRSPHLTQRLLALEAGLQLREELKTTPPLRHRPAEVVQFPTRVRR